MGHRKVSPPLRGQQASSLRRVSGRGPWGPLGPACRTVQSEVSAPTVAAPRLEPGPPGSRLSCPSLVATEAGGWVKCHLAQTGWRDRDLRPVARGLSGPGPQSRLHVHRPFSFLSFLPGGFCLSCPPKQPGVTKAPDEPGVNPDLCLAGLWPQRVPSDPRAPAS